MHNYSEFAVHLAINIRSELEIYLSHLTMSSALSRNVILLK